MPLKKVLAIRADVQVCIVNLLKKKRIILSKRVYQQVPADLVPSHELF